MSKKTATEVAFICAENLTRWCDGRKRGFSYWALVLRRAIPRPAKQDPVEQEIPVLGLEQCRC
jgi:hypothetical protein